MAKIFGKNQMKLTWIFRDGRLTSTGTALAGLAGAGFIAYTLFLAESFFFGMLSFICGCSLRGFAGLSNNAASIGLRPFANDHLGWRKAKESYEQEPPPESEGSEKQ